MIGHVRVEHPTSTETLFLSCLESWERGHSTPEMPIEQPWIKMARCKLEGWKACFAERVVIEECKLKWFGSSIV